MTVTDTAAPVEDDYARLRAVVLRCAAHTNGPRLLADFAAGLEGDDLAMLERIVADMAADHWRATPATMAHHLSTNDPEPYELFPYAELLGRKWTQLEDGSDPFQIWNLPAQYGKSRLCQWGLAWSLDRHPAHRYITTSYGDELADRNGLAVRDLLEEHEELRVELRRDQKRQDRFSTSAGGGLLAAGIFAGMTGFGADGIVIDDPFKGWEQAHSEAHRQKVLQTYRSVIFLRRRHGKAWILIVMTRWHEGDLAGQLIDEAQRNIGKPFTVVRLPEIAEAAKPDSPNPILRLPDPLGRKPGELLEPRKFDAEAVADKHATLGSYLTAGMAQQRPAPEEGTDIKRAWFQVEETIPAVAEEAITSWDLKMKDNERGSYVVGQMWWRVGNGYWLLDQLRGQWDEPTTKVAIALLAVRHPEATAHLVENAAKGPEVMAALRQPQPDYEVSDEVADKLGMTGGEREAVAELIQRGMSGLIGVPPIGDKRVRMRAQTPYIEAGNVHLPAAHVGPPANPTFVPLYLEEMAAFPNGSNDDQVDATSQALSRLAKGPSVAEDTGLGSLPEISPMAERNRPSNILVPIPSRR